MVPWGVMQSAFRARALWGINWTAQTQPVNYMTEETWRSNSPPLLEAVTHVSAGCFQFVFWDSNIPTERRGMTSVKGRVLAFNRTSLQQTTAVMSLDSWYMFYLMSYLGHSTSTTLGGTDRQCICFSVSPLTLLLLACSNVLNPIETGFHACGNWGEKRLLLRSQQAVGGTCFYPHSF